MSIIHEALKKVQSNRSENKTLKDQPAAAPEPVRATLTKAKIPAAKKPPTVVGVALWGFLILGICGFAFYNLYEFIIHTTEVTVAKTSPAAGQASPTIILAAPAPLPAPVASPPRIKKGEILLSGIVLMDGKTFALINKEFYQVGETVEGATITNITSDSVEVLQKGKTRVIKTIRPE